jgi:hypothetical protein
MFKFCEARILDCLNVRFRSIAVNLAICLQDSYDLEADIPEVEIWS